MRRTLTPTPAGAAFTMVELLVVVAIIAVLVGVLLPALGSARKTARLTQCASNLHYVGLGVHMYATQHNGTLPQGPDAPAPPFYAMSLMATNQLSSAGDQNYIGLGLLFRDDFQNPESVFCPGDDDPVDFGVELTKIGTADAFASYFYRHGAEQTSNLVDNLGDNTAGGRAVALALDRNFVNVHTTHQRKQVNILYIDGHTERRSNAAGDYQTTTGAPAQMHAMFRKADGAK